MNKLTSYLKLALAGRVGWSSRAGRAADARLESSASAPGRCAIDVCSRSSFSLSGWMNKEGEKGGA